MLPSDSTTQHVETSEVDFSQYLEAKPSHLFPNQKLFFRHQWFTNGIADLNSIKAIVVVVHGYGEYASFLTIQKLAGFFNQQDVAVYSFDLRLFNKFISVNTQTGLMKLVDPDLVTFDEVVQDVQIALENVFACFPPVQYPNLKVLLCGYSIGATISMMFLCKIYNGLPDKRLVGFIFCAPFFHIFADKECEESNSWTTYLMKQALYWLPNYAIFNFDVNTVKQNFSTDDSYLEMLENDPKIRENCRSTLPSHACMLPSCNGRFANSCLSLLEALNEAITHPKQTFETKNRRKLKILLMHGEKDAFFPSSQSEKWFNSMNQYHECYLQKYPDLKHYLLYDSGNDQVFTDLSFFLNKVTQCSK